MFGSFFYLEPRIRSSALQEVLFLFSLRATPLFPSLDERDPFFAAFFTQVFLWFQRPLLFPPLKSIFCWSVGLPAFLRHPRAVFMLSPYPALGRRLFFKGGRRSHSIPFGLSFRRA